MRLGVARIECDQFAVSLDRGHVIGLLHQGEAEVVERDLVIRFEFENGVEFGDCGVGLALLDQRKRQVVASLKRFGLSFTPARRASTALSKSSSARSALPSAA